MLTAHLPPHEYNVLLTFAKGKKYIIEVGVFEGATSKAFCQSMDSGGKLYLIDPYFLELRLEKLLNFSFPQFIARREVKKWKHQVEFIRQTSVEASHTLLKSQVKAELIFIDAVHDYKSVLEDFKIWIPLLSPDGVMAFHDSRICAARQDLNAQTGPVRLVNEIIEGKHGNWQVVATADTLTVIIKKELRCDRKNQKFD